MNEKENKRGESEDLRQYLKSLNVERKDADHRKFDVSFSVDEIGVVDVGIDWPEEDAPDIISMIGTLLFSINSGLLKNLILEAITDSSQKYPELKECIQKSVETWLELENSSSGHPCVRPTDTLKNV